MTRPIGSASLQRLARTQMPTPDRDVEAIGARRRDRGELRGAALRAGLMAQGVPATARVPFAVHALPDELRCQRTMRERAGQEPPVAAGPDKPPAQRVAS
jgi:hypothetical protein